MNTVMKKSRYISGSSVHSLQRRSRLFVSALAGLLSLGAVLSQPAIAEGSDSAASAQKTSRPKICLVLSGGGARGAAHVGVLKVLEEYRVPVDCIVGTSMGSLVGAAYATGMNLEQMDTVMASISTEKLFKEEPPRQEQIMRRKMDDYSILFTPEVGVAADGIRIGKGLVTGVQMESVLRRLAQVKGYYKFDNLPIPYRAVATDLVTGEARVFSEGDLALVMRASMSVPGAVAPAEFNGMILVDGMLTSNLPVQTAREMGADIIIAVNVGTPLLKREEITGIVGVSGQMLSILTEQNVQESLDALNEKDILISPDLGDYSTGDFDFLPKIVPQGEKAARAQAQRLAALSIPEAEYAALRQRQQVAAVPDTEPVDEIRFPDLKRVNPVTVQRVMETKVGEPLDQDTVDRDMLRIYATGDFEHVNYRIQKEGERRVMVVEAVEKSWGPDYLRFGLGLSSDFTGDAFFNFLASYRKTWLNRLGAEWRNDFQVGRTSRVFSEFYQPLEARSYLFVAPSIELERRSTTLYQNDERIARYDMETQRAGFDIGSQFYRYGELRLGVVGGNGSPSLDTGPAWLEPAEDDIAEGAYVFKMGFDQLDSVNFPRQGWRGRARVYDSTEDLGADNEYTRLDADGLAVGTFGPHTFSVAARVGDRLGDNPLPLYDQFQWGGFLQQSGYATGQLLGQGLKYGRVMYYHQISRGSFFDGAYSGVALEASEIEDPMIPGDYEEGEMLKSVGVFIGTDSPIGPVYLGYGRAEDGNEAAYFFLGKPY